MVKNIRRPVTTADQVEKCLASRFSAPEFAFLPQCRNGTGYKRDRTRTADAIALSLWPSRGLDLHGFEIKVWRQDWQKELSDPSKAEEIQRFCDRWWIVAGDTDIVLPGELPPTWGLMVKHGNGLRVVTEAPKLAAQPVDKPMLCSILRKASELMIPLSQVQERINAAHAEGYENGESRATWQAKDDRQIIERFEREAGISLNRDWLAAADTGRAVKFVMQTKIHESVDLARELLKTAESVAKTLRDGLAALEDRPGNVERESG